MSATKAKPKEKSARAPSLESLPKEAELQLRSNSKTIIRKFWTGLEEAMGRGEKWAFEMTARIFAYDKAPGGVTIYNQHLNQHLQLTGAAANSVAGAQRVRSLDQIINRLDVTEEKNRFLTAQQDVDVIDIEPEDSGEVLSDDDLAGIEEAAGGVPAI